MAETVNLSAEAKYGYSGQYIAKLTGRAERVQFSRVFVGSKSGKRSEVSSYETDEIGLYETCDVTKRGKDKDYWLVLPWRDGLVKLRSDSTDALKIAKRLGNGETLEQIVVVELGDPLTDCQWYGVCSVCEHELADGQSCPEHPDGHRVSMSRYVHRKGPNGNTIHALVYSIRTPGQVRKAQAAGDLDGAVDAIVAALSALPAPMQRKALAAARARLFPPNESAPETQTSVDPGD